MTAPKLCIVIPTYNELLTIGSLLKKLISVSKNLPYETSILVVDDSSPDGTALVVDVYARKYPFIHLLSRPKKTGLGSAYLSGFLHAQLRWNPDVVLQMDADGSHDPEAIPSLLNALGSADVVLGSRYIPGGQTPAWSVRRRMISKAANLLAKRAISGNISDATSGFRAFKRDVLTSVLTSKFGVRGFAYQIRFIQVALQHGFQIKEFPIYFSDRTTGTSKLGFSDILEFAGLTLKGIIIKLFSSMGTFRLKRVTN